MSAAMSNPSGRARPVLAAFSRQVLHLGDVGSGQLAKTINNMLLWAAMAANFEALTLAKQLGADIPRLVEALGHGSGANWSLSRWGKSTGKWAEKDMDVALELAQHAKVPAPLGAPGRSADEADQPGQDESAIVLTGMRRRRGMS